MEIDVEMVRDIQERVILHWNYRNLREIPMEVLLHGNHIQEIYLKRNCIEKLPTEIGKLRNLTNLYLMGNQLSTLPEEMGQLRCLKVLDLSQNYFRHLPSSIGDLNELQHLHLTQNQLEYLPQELSRLKKLVFLEMTGNSLSQLPPQVVQGLESLEELAVDRNPISLLPRNICELPYLRYLSACKCKLVSLPAMPFYKLRDGNRDRPRENTDALTQFAPPVQFLFDGNAGLNYLPYWVFQLMGPNVDCFGCALECSDDDNLDTATTKESPRQQQQWSSKRQYERPKIKLKIRGHWHTLHFDEDLMKLCQVIGRNELPSLLELCLRHVYNHRDYLRIHTLPPVNERPMPTHTTHALQFDVELGSPVTLTPHTEHEHKPWSNVEYIFNPIGLDDSSCSRNNCSHHHDFSQNSGYEEDHEDSFQGEVTLPWNLERILSLGPFARCFECLQSIFCETWPLIFRLPNINNVDPHNQEDHAPLPPFDANHIRTQGNISTCCVHFCNSQCLKNFRRLSELAISPAYIDIKFIIDNELSWEII